MNYNWDWSIPFSHPYAGWLLMGLQVTLVIASSAIVFAFLIGSTVGVLCTVESPLARLAATAYVELFRNIPLLVQLFIWFFVIPELLPERWGYFVKRQLPYPAIVTAIVCMAFYQAASIAETVRAGIQAISRGQRFAGLAIGLSQFQVYRYILLPVMFRTIVPPLASSFLATVKDSSLALTIGVLEITAQSRQIETYTFHGFEAFTAATVLYQMITIIVIIVMQFVEKRLRIPGMLSLAQKDRV
jgi:glutamate/aspartate transport system permease protein